MTAGRTRVLRAAAALALVAAVAGAYLLVRGAAPSPARPTPGPTASAATPVAPAAAPVAPAPADEQDPEEAQLEAVRAELLHDSGALAGKLGAPRTGQQALRKRLPIAPNALTPIVDMGEQAVAHGLPMNLAWFETTLDAPAVLEFYAHHFRSLGLSFVGVAEAMKLIGHPALSATDMAEQVQLTVMALEHEGGTTVILGLADMLPENRILDELGDLPAYPGTTPLAVRATDLETRSTTVSFDTRDSVEEVAAFYRARLGQAGYTEAREPESETKGAVTVMRFAAPGRRWNLTLSNQGEKTIATAISTLEEVLP